MFFVVVVMCISTVFANDVYSQKNYEPLESEAFIRILERRCEPDDWPCIFKYISNQKTPLPMSYVTPVHHDTWRRTSILGPFGFAYRSARVYGGFVLDGCVVREPDQTRECSPSYTDEQFIKDTLDGIVSKCNRMKYCGTDLGEGKGANNCYLRDLNSIVRRSTALISALKRNGTTCPLPFNMHNQVQATWNKDDLIGVVMFYSRQLPFARKVLEKLGRPDLSIYVLRD